jgi:hypothetical protein
MNEAKDGDGSDMVLNVAATTSDAPTFLHVSSWTASQLSVGQRIVVDWGESSYWRGKMSREWAEADPAVETARRRNRALMERLSAMASRPEIATEALMLHASVRDFDQFAGDYKFRLDVLKEYIFESVRRDEFPSLPSRRRCMFLFDDGPDPDAYLATMPGMAQIRKTLLRVRPLADAQWFRAKPSLLNCNWRTPAEIEQQARQYWGGTDPQLDAEVLLVGPLEIVEVLR